MKELDQGYKFTKAQLAELEQLRQQVAELEAENKDVQHVSQLHYDQNLSLRQQLAASQLDNRELRSALEGAYDYVDGAVQDHYESYGDLLPDRLEYKLLVKVECDEVLPTQTDTEALEKYLADRLGEKQAEIDRLMLEFCPEEMTQEQIDEWSKHQQPLEKP